jgi:hypothetical protein
MLPNWTRVRLTQNVPCSLGELGDEGVIVDNLLANNKQFYIVELPDKEEIVTVEEENLVNVDLN